MLLNVEMLTSDITGGKPVDVSESLESLMKKKKGPGLSENKVPHWT